MPLPAVDPNATVRPQHAMGRVASTGAGRAHHERRAGATGRSIRVLALRKAGP